VSAGRHHKVKTFVEKKRRRAEEGGGGGKNPAHDARRNQEDGEVLEKDAFFRRGRGRLAPHY